MLMPSIFGDSFVDDLVDNFLTAPNHYIPRAQRILSMNADVKEFKDHYEISLELPGYRKEDLKADLTDGYLTISATRGNDDDEKDEKGEKEGKYIRRERYYGQMQRSFYVGEDIQYEDIHAAFENGILKLSVAKKDAKPQVDQKQYIPIDG